MGIGVLTSQTEKLTNDFFVNLTDMKYEWVKTADPQVFQAKERATGNAAPFKASLVDMAFGSNFELRAIVEHYACDDARQEFVNDFVKAFAKVMSNDIY